MSSATYVYCIVRGARKPSVARVPTGVPGASPPDAIPCGASTYLIAATVPLERYRGERLDRTVSDLEAVGRIALAHEAVVEHFSRRRTLTVIPLKLFTLFSAPERAVADIAKRRREVDAAMRRIGGAEEWGVRVTRQRDEGTGSRVTRAAGRAGTTSGTAFLAARKAARDEARALATAAADAAAGSFNRLARLARASHARETAAPAGATPPLLDAAFLVPLDRRTRFKSAVRREAAACARAGAVLTLTGPWPAYNFVGSAT